MKNHPWQKAIKTDRRVVKKSSKTVGYLDESLDDLRFMRSIEMEREQDFLDEVKRSGVVHIMQ